MFAPISYLPHYIPDLLFLLKAYSFSDSVHQFLWLANLFSLCMSKNTFILFLLLNNSLDGYKI